MTNTSQQKQFAAIQKSNGVLGQRQSRGQKRRRPVRNSMVTKYSSPLVSTQINSEMSKFQYHVKAYARPVKLQRSQSLLAFQTFSPVSNSMDQIIS